MLINLHEIEGPILVHKDEVMIFMPLNAGNDYDAGARTLIVIKDTILGETVYKRIHVIETEHEVKTLLQCASKK